MATPHLAPHILENSASKNRMLRVVQQTILLDANNDLVPIDFLHDHSKFPMVSRHLDYFIWFIKPLIHVKYKTTGLIACPWSNPLAWSLLFSLQGALEVYTSVYISLSPLVCQSTLRDHPNQDENSIRTYCSIGPNYPDSNCPLNG